MIIKGFLKNKKNYKCLVILIISIFILTILLLLKSYYINKINKFNEDSLFNFRVNIDLYDDIKNINNIKDLYVSILGKYDSNVINLLASKDNNTLKNNEIIINKKIFNNVHINDLISINYQNKNFEFIVKDVIDNINYDTIAYINYDYLQEIANGEKEFWMYITLNNYLDFDNTKYELQNLHGFNASVDKITNNKILEIDYEFHLAIVNIILFFYYIVLVIIICFILYSVIHNSEDNNYLYKCFGYNFNQIICINIINICIIFLIPIFISIIFYYLIYLIL